MNMIVPIDDRTKNIACYNTRNQSDDIVKSKDT